MKKMKLLFVLAAICTLVGVAAADFNIIDRNTFKANTVNGARVDDNGYAYTNEAFKDRDFGTLIPSGLGIVASLGAGKAVVAPQAMDISKYSKLTLMLTWNFAAAADSDSVNIVVNLYGKVSQNMGDGINNQLFIRLPSQATSATSTTDTARVWYPTNVTATPQSFSPPTLYITRNKATGVNYVGTAYDHASSWIAAMQPRWFWTGVGSCAISLDNIPGIGAYPYLGISIANANVTKSVTNLTASVWASR